MVDQKEQAAGLEQGFARSTATRRAVLNAVIRWKGHFSAEELCKSLPGVSRATVYRTLASLQETEVVCRVLVDGGAPRYQVGGTKHHHHLVCTGCGEVQDIADCGVDDFALTIANQFGFTLEGHRLEIYGTCEVCMARR